MRRPSDLTVTFGLLLVCGLLWGPEPASGLETASAPERTERHEVPEHTRIPAFARLYGTGCSTCHTAAPKLNVLGEAFRLSGYQMPENDLLVRRDEPVALGAEPWKDVWPRAVWPSDLPGITPLALRIQTDVRALGRPGGGREVSFGFPWEVYLLAGAPLGDDIGAFLEIEWSEESGIEVVQAKIAFQDVVPGLPDGAANLWLGRQDPFLLTFTDRQIDRVGVVGFSWQRFNLSQLSLTGPAGEVVRQRNDLRLGGGLPTIEVNGVIAGRLHYGLGLSQGAESGTRDNNAHKDPYYRIRYKFGGLNLRGRYDPGGGPVLGTGGQLQDRSIIIEHFGYRGDESTADDPQGPHRAIGFSARALYGPWDVGGGWVRRSFDRPFATATGEVRGRSWFAKAEHMVFPWLLGSLKYDRFDADADAQALPAGHTLDSAARRVVAPGAVLLLRQNVRAVVEGRIFLSGDSFRAAGATRSSDLFLRLDVTF